MLHGLIKYPTIHEMLDTSTPAPDPDVHADVITYTDMYAHRRGTQGNGLFIAQ